MFNKTSPPATWLLYRGFVFYFILFFFFMAWDFFRFRSHTRRAKVCHKIAQGGKWSITDEDETVHFQNASLREQSSGRPPDGPAWQQTISGNHEALHLCWNHRITQTTLPWRTPSHPPAQIMTGGLAAPWRRLAPKRSQSRNARSVCSYFKGGGALGRRDLFLERFLI